MNIKSDISQKGDLTLVIMAAGLGSRYQGLKQLDGMGPNGELILDYSIYDARLAGFNHFVLIIREETESLFANTIKKRWGNNFPVKFLSQKLEDLVGFSTADSLLFKNRERPWGTGHALLACRNDVTTPFVILNADDFYGRKAFLVLANYLRSKHKHPLSSDIASGAMVGYKLEDTLSESGIVSRGICEVDPSGGKLKSIEEKKGLKKINESEVVDSEKKVFPLASDVSMNIWGFFPNIFSLFASAFSKFLENYHFQGQQTEFYIPENINTLIKNQQLEISVLQASSPWFGITYKEDKEKVQQKLIQLRQEYIWTAPKD